MIGCVSFQGWMAGGMIISTIL